MSIRAFFKSVVTTPGTVRYTKALFNEYVAFCLSQSQQPVSFKKFLSAAQEYGGEEFVQNQKKHLIFKEVVK